MDRMRTFIALELPAPTRAALAAVQQNLKIADPVAARAVKWVDPEGMHLTLKFLGETPADKVEPITEAMRRLAMGRTPVTLQLGRAGCFPNPRQPRVLWLGVEGETETLARLVAALEESVAPLGFPSEGRHFSPHLTLGRVRENASALERQRVGLAIQSLRLPSGQPFSLGAISFMRSELRREGALYTRISEAQMGASVLLPDPR